MSLQWESKQEQSCIFAVSVQDAYLPQRLVDKLMYMYNYIEMARVTGVPMSYLLTRGQSIKVFSQILRKARQKNLLVPNLKVRLIPKSPPAGPEHCRPPPAPPERQMPAFRSTAARNEDSD